MEPSAAPIDGDDVLVDRSHPGVALVTLNRPHHLNALTSEMLAHIYEVLEGSGMRRDLLPGASLW